MTPAEQCAKLMLDTWGPPTPMYVTYDPQHGPYAVGTIVMGIGAAAEGRRFQATGVSSDGSTPWIAWIALDPPK